MEQIIKIEVPEGKKAVYNESTKTIEFVDIEPIRSKSWEEFCKNHPNVSHEEWCLDNQRGYIAHYGIKGCKRNNTHKTLIATKEDAEGILALVQLTRLYDEWVGDWKPVYNDVSFIGQSLVIDENTFPGEYRIVGETYVRE